MAYSSGTFSRLYDWTDDRDNGIKIRADRMDAEFDGIATGLTTALLKDGTQTATAKIPFAVGLSVIDNQTVLLGTNSDIAIQYDETTNDSLEIAANVEGAALNVVLKADQGDDNADQHKLSIADGGTLTLGSKISGSFVTYLTHTPNATVASSTLAVAGNLTVGGNLTLGSGAELSEAELEMLDGLTGGTVTASKAVVVDANKDIASFRNITLTGELDAGSLDVSGDADIDGTLEADAMTLNGTAITTTATLSTGVSNGNVLVATSGIADNDFLKVDGTSIEGRSSSEVLSDIGGQAALTFGISDTNIPIFTSGVADDDFLRVNGTSIEGRSASEVLSDIGASAVAGSSSIVTTGALNAGSITSGFGNIDTGSSTITTTGAITGGSLVADNITIDGTEIDLSSGDLTVDVAGDITLDAGGGDILFEKAGTTFLKFTESSGDAIINQNVSDKDIKFNGNDGGSGITALSLDMSEGGRAAFNSHVDMSGILIYSTLGSGAKAIQTTASGSHSYNAGFFRNSSGSEVGSITVGTGSTAFNTSSDYRLKENVSYSFDATSRLKQLKPARFNFITDADTTVDGFLAHEVSSIVPEAITGTKDATQEIKNVILNADGSFLTDNINQKKWEEGKIDKIYADNTTWVASKTVPDYQSIDQSKIVPLLTKTILELEARITALESA